MAQREQHERVKRMDRWAGKLLEHKAVVVAMLVVIAMASGLAMATWGGESDGVSFDRDATSVERADTGSAGASDDGDPSSDSKKAIVASEVYVDVDGAVVTPGVYRLREGARVA